jgi:hypothetical protein
MVAALVMSMGAFGASSAGGAAGGTVCSTSADTAVFAPALPVLSSKVLVKGTLSATGTVGKCKGGGVTSGHTTFKSSKSTTGANCSTLAKPNPASKGTIGKLTIVWNTGKTSTVASFTVKQTKTVTTATTTGKITAGLFVGMTITGSVKYSLPKGACGSKPLAKVTYVQVGRFVIGAGATHSVSADSPASGSTVPESGSFNLVWTGGGVTGGALNTTACDAAGNPADPFGANVPYLLWVLTVDGGSIDHTTLPPILHVAGGGDYPTSAVNGNANQFTTPFFPLAGLVGTNAEMNVVTSGNGAWTLEISHGCPSVAAAGPTVAKDAKGSYDDTFTWSLAKSVDQSAVTVTDTGTNNTTGTVTVNYTITDSNSDSVVSNVKVTGTITVTNPNSAGVPITGVSDQLSDGTVCTVTGGGAQTLASGDTKFPYSCSLSAVPSGSLTNTVTVSWIAQTLSDGSTLAAGPATFTSGPILFTANEIDNCETLTDSAVEGPQGQVVCAASDTAGSQTFTYSRGLTIPPLGTCVNDPNTATSTTNDTLTPVSAHATVRVCHFRAALTIGYWANHLDKTGQPYCGNLPGGTGCSNNGPWAKPYLPQPIGPYSVSSILNAAQVFASNNCSNASTSGQNAFACLAAQQLAAELNVANGANFCIGGVISSANSFLSGGTVDGVAGRSYPGPGVSISPSVTTAQRNEALVLKNKLANYNQGGGC